MQGWLSNLFALSHHSARARAQHADLEDRKDPEPLWLPARASMIILTTVVVTLLVWLAYALSWLP